MSSSFLSQTEIEQLLSRLNPENTNQALPCKEEAGPEPVRGPEPDTTGAAEHPTDAGGEPAQQEVELVSFPELKEGRIPGKNNLELFYDTPVTLLLELGSAELKVGEVLALQKNSIIKLDRLAGENMTLLVNGRPLASGEVVVINENFGFRVTLVGNPGRETVEKG
jgi:flagellar motor switch protein FliN/FliY